MNVLLAVLGLLVLVAAGTPTRPADDARAWKDACRLSGYSCRWIPIPDVVRAPLERPILGRYKMGERHVLLLETLRGNLARAILVHEMVHYLQWKHGRWKFTLASTCENEHEAFEASNALLRELGDTKHVWDWAELREMYGCPL